VAFPARQHQESLVVPTRGRGLVDVTSEVAAVVSRSGVTTGLAVVFCAHTAASLLIQENASPDAARDLLAWLARLAPDGDPRYEHDAEGPDDMAAHLRSAVTRTSETVPVADGRLALGRWQGLFLAEHRARAQRRTLVVHVTGTGPPSGGR
jgi:secondary thiamine-phosphate synthase enzyme